MSPNVPTRRALYVSAFLPDESAPHAGGQAAFQNRKDLTLAGYEVTTVICTTEAAARPANEHRTIVFRQTRAAALGGYLVNFMTGRTEGLLAWPVLDTRANIAFERTLRLELAHGGYELVFADFTQVLLPIVRAMAGLLERPRSCCCAHDLFVQKLLRSASVIARVLTGPVVRAERALLSQFDEVVTLSRKDQLIAEKLYDLPCVRVRPWTPPEWTLAINRLPERIHTAELLFFANFNRPENAEAVAWLLQLAWPAIKHAVPCATLVLGGAGSDQVTLPNGTEGVRHTGYVANPKDLFECCEFAIAPLALGAGVKFKVLEAIASGVSVVGTKVALEGIEMGPLTVEATRSYFADTVISLLNQRLDCKPVSG